MSALNSQAPNTNGIAKNGAEKRGFINFFILFFRGYGKLMYCGFLTLLFNLLIIPSGLGEVGQARIARIAVRDRHSFGSDYFEAIKKNWKLALVSGLINNIIFIFSAMSLYTMITNKDAGNPLMLIITAFALLLITFIKYYTSPIMLTFNVTMGQLYKNAIILSFAGFWRNILILVLHISAHIVILLPLLIDIYVGTGIAICLYLLLMPAFMSFATQYNVYPVMFKYMIAPFMEKHPGEGTETLHELGLLEETAEQIMQDATE